MEALNLVSTFSLETIRDQTKPNGMRQHLLEFLQRAFAFFQRLAETPVGGTFLSLVLSLLGFAILVVVLYLAGGTHLAVEP